MRFEVKLNIKLFPKFFGSPANTTMFNCSCLLNSKDKTIHFAEYLILFPVVCMKIFKWNTLH